MPTVETTAPETPLRTVGAVVDKRIGGLQRSYLANESAGVAALARLRRAVGKDPGEIADVFEYTLAPEFIGAGAGDDATLGEIAAHHALTLYAMHQQSQSQRMHQRGHRFGAAVRKLHPDEPKLPPDPVLRRFQTLATADSMDELIHHIRGMVQLLRGHQVPLDYGLLADQFVQWQRPGGAAKVRLRWGREFHRIKQPSTD